MRSYLGLIALPGLLIACLGACVEARADAEKKVTLLRTPEGIEFGLLGAKPASPAPTLFVFANNIEETLGDLKYYNEVGKILGEKGFLSVALDLPCHGKDNKEKESNQLIGWRKRLEGGDNLIPAFTAKCIKVLDYLVQEGYTDPKHVAACGTSRGGFVALHVAAAEPRVRCVAAFAPVVNLLALTEFKGMENHAATKSLALERIADKLAGRPVWICIGNNDERVNTDAAIAFSRKVVHSSVAQNKPPLVEIHVMTSVGHSIHPTAHSEAAAWIEARVKEAR